MFIPLHVACLDIKITLLFQLPAVIGRAPLSCLILIRKELNNDRIEVGLIKEVALIYEEIEIDGPTSSPSSLTCVPATQDK